MGGNENELNLQITIVGSSGGMIIMRDGKTELWVNCVKM